MTNDMLSPSRKFQRICLVTDELPGFGPSGGIGAAFEELAVTLARAEHDVTILYCGPRGEGGTLPEAGMAFFRNEGIEVMLLDTERFTNVRWDLRANAYSVWRTLQALDGDFDVIHFHDYKGLGFYACESKRQGIALQETQLVLQLHGPTRWTVESNRQFFSVESQLVADQLERGSVEMADVRVSPSDYLAGWVRTHWSLPESCEIETIPNLCSLLAQRLHRTRRKGRASDGTNGPVRNLVVFGRHEARKGIDIASSALSRLNDTLAERDIVVHFVGQQGMVNGQPSALYFTKAAKSWTFDYTFNFGLTRFTAGEYIAGLDNVLVVVPAPVENSPYAVLEPLILGLPVLSSDGGGGGELIAPVSRPDFCCRMDASGLEAAIRSLLDDPSPECAQSSRPEDIETRWLDFHEKHSRVGGPCVEIEGPEPLVTVGITHFERPHKLADAVISMLKQDYANLEIIVIDDGSRDPEAVEALDELSILLDRSGVKLLREKNRYLGAARNKIVEHASGEYIVFLDDDDIALPNLVSTLVGSALRTKAAVTSCLSHYMNEDARAEILAGQEVRDVVDYFPTGGPLSLSMEQNVFGTATSLIRLADLREIGGYTELRNVGNEDFELYIRIAQEGKRVVVCPLPLFLYEVGRPSMLSATSMDTSFRRCFDAVEFDRNSPEWSDYTNLNIGRHLAPQAHNRLLWLNSFQDDTDERNRLCDRGTNARDYVRLAAGVAERTGAQRLAMAFEHAFDVADRLAGGPIASETESQGVSIFKRNPVSRTPVADDAPLAKTLRQARHLIAMGDAEIGLARLQHYIDTTHSLDDTILTPIWEVASVPTSDAIRAAVTKLVETLRDKRYRGEPGRILLAVLGVVNHHELWTLQAEIVMQIVDLDKAEYVGRYKDLHKGIERGNVEPFTHFVNSGQREGRTGFSTVTAALKTLGDAVGTTYVLADVDDLVRVDDRKAA